MSSSLSERTPPTPQDLHLTTLLKLMDPEFKDSVVTRVLLHRSQLSADVQSALDNAVNREVRVPGFLRYPERAPAPILKQALLPALTESGPLAGAILGAWLAVHSSLREVVTEHLRSRGIGTGHQDFSQHQLKDFWSGDDWMSERDSILASNADLDKDDVALMLCCVTGRMPSANVKSSGEENPTMDQTILDQALSYLEELPADSPEWEGVPGFLSSVAELSDAKAAERDAKASMEALETAISEFLSGHSVQLDYFEFDVSVWTVPSDCDPSVVSEAFDLLGQLSGLIHEYDSIPHQGPTHAETVRLNNRRDEYVHRISDVKSKLDRMLTSGDGPDNTPGQPNVGKDVSDEVPSEPELDEGGPAATIQPVAPAMSADATLSSLSLSDRNLDFDPATFDYPVALENSTDIVTVTPVPNHSEATIEVIVESQDDDASRPPESAAGIYTIGKIPVGRTRIFVNVTAEDRKTTRIYILAVTRTPSSDATLDNLELSVGDVEFSPDLTEYSVGLADGGDALSLAFETAHEDATVKVNLERPDGVTTDAIESGDGRCDISGLTEGPSLLSIVVTAGDSITTRTYTIELTRQSSQSTDYVELMWSLVAQDDLAGAYWVSKSLVAQGQAPPCLPALLKAVQGARWLSPDSGNFIEDLSNTVSEASPPFGDDALAMLGLSAALQPSITAPETNLLAWLVTPEHLLSLEGFVAPVRDFASRGYALRPEHIRGDEGQRRLDDLIANASSDAGRWLEDAERRHHNLVRATNVLRHLCADGGMLNGLLRAAADDRRGEVASVRSDVDALKQDSYRTEVIVEADGIVLGSSPRNEITGAARAWLHRAIGEACDLASWWCDLVGRSNEANEQAQNQWMSDRVSELRAHIESASGTVFAELSTIASDSDRSDASASALCLARSIHRMLDYLSIEPGLDLQPKTPSIVTDLQTIVQYNGRQSSGNGSADQLEVSLSRRLLWIPAIDLASDGRPMNPQAPVNLSEADRDWFSCDTPIDAAIRARVETSDFRFLDLLETVWATERSDDIDSLYSADLAAAKETLHGHLSSAREGVDQAANDGVIEYEGARWNEFGHAIDDIFVDEVLNFKEAHDTLEAIQMSVGNERTRRREELMGDWEDLSLDSLGDSDREVEFIKGLKGTFELASREKSLDIRVMEDCVSRIRNYRSGDLHVLILARVDGSRTTLEEFLSFCSGMRDRQTNFGGGGLRNIVRRSRGEK